MRRVWNAGTAFIAVVDDDAVFIGISTTHLSLLYLHVPALNRLSTYNLPFKCLNDSDYLLTNLFAFLFGISRAESLGTILATIIRSIALDVL